jgi:hypothetical protein
VEAVGWTCRGWILSIIRILLGSKLDVVLEDEVVAARCTRQKVATCGERERGRSRK